MASRVRNGDAERARHIGRQLQAGEVWFNSEQLVLPQAAWGGLQA